MHRTTGVGLIMLALAIAACGDDSHSNPDARVFPDAPQMIDAPIMIDAPNADAEMSASPAIQDARNAADGPVNIAISGALITYVRPLIGTDPAGFFVQDDQIGPALFIAVDPSTLNPVPAAGDKVTFTVTNMATTGGGNVVRQADAITNFSVLSSGNDLSGLLQEVSSAADLVTALDSYESEYIAINATVTADFAGAGTGYSSAGIDTAGLTADPNLKVRLPNTLITALDVDNTCSIQLTGIMWRYGGQAQPSGWAAQDLAVSNCPAPQVVGASATSDTTTVVVSFDRAIDGASITDAANQITFDNGVTAASAMAAGRDVRVTLAGAGLVTLLDYTVTVADTVTDTQGVGVDQAFNTATFRLNLCGNGNMDAGEECDDGANEPFDGCSPGCVTEAVTHLLISEFVVTPTGGEFVEIYNPTGQTVDLANVWVADINDYYLIAAGGVVPNSSDFIANFATGTVAAGQFITLSLEPGTTAFNTAYGFDPDYDMSTVGGTVGSSAGLTNSQEVLVLFEWDGMSTTVRDLDIVLYGGTTNQINKTGVAGYLADNPSNTFATSPSTGAAHRCDSAESTETLVGGNGASGHDETSEDHAASWRVAAASPGAAPPATTCNP